MSSWERRRPAGILKKTNHRGTETPRKTKRGHYAREARGAGLLAFVFLCASVVGLMMPAGRRRAQRNLLRRHAAIDHQFRAGDPG